MVKTAKRGLRTVANKAEKERLRYIDCNIPAKLFFHILSTEDYTLCDEADFDNIFDEYFLLKPNKRLINWMRKKAKVNYLTAVKEGIRATLMQIYYVPMPPELLVKTIEILNNYDEVKPKFNLSKGLEVEVQRIQNSVLGILQNRINMETEDKQKKTEEVKNSFYREKILLGRAVGVEIKEDITMYEWIEMVNIAEEEQKQRKNGK